MCGPIVAACSHASVRPGVSRWRLALFYNLGRVASYSAAGALEALFGRVTLSTRGAAFMYASMPYVASAALLVIALYVAGFSRVKRVLEAAGSIVWLRIKPWSRRFLPADTPARALGLGAIWGWLPCGMVYAVLVTAIAAADPIDGAFIMFAFGVGTLPNVLALSAITSRLRALRSKSLRYVAAAALAAFAVIGPVAAHYVHGATAAALYCHPDDPGQLR
jgi:sulfite exporter TauE/SafE